MYDQSFIQNPKYRKIYGEMEDVTRKEADSLYKKIISEMASGLKQYGFRKSKPTTLERNNGCMLQILNFQRYTHLPVITINIAIRPVFISTTDDVILPFCRRIHVFDSKESSWYPIKRDTKAVSIELLSIIVEKVFPYFESLDSPEKIVENREELESIGNVSPVSEIMYCALKSCNSAVSLQYIDKEIKRVNARLAEGDTREYSSYLEYYYNIKDLVTSSRWQEISNLLNSYEEEFIQKKFLKEKK